MAKLSDLTPIDDADVSLLDILVGNDKNEAGDTTVGTRKFTLGQLSALFGARIEDPVADSAARLALTTGSRTFVEQTDQPGVIYLQTGDDASDANNWIALTNPAASQAEAEAGTEAAIRAFSPERVKQAIVARAEVEVVADATARKALSVDVGTWVTQTDLPNVVWRLVDADATQDASWHGLPYTTDPDGDIIVSMELADVTGIVPDANTLGHVNGVPVIGDGAKLEGNQIAMYSDSPFTLVGKTDGTVDLKNWSVVPASSYNSTIGPEFIVLGFRVTEIGASAFSYMSYAADEVPLRFPPNLVTIGNSGFNGTVIDSFVFNEKLATIGNSAFAETGSPRWDLKLPPLITSLDYGTFYNCNVKSITLNEGLLTIGDYCFDSVTIHTPSDIVLPDSVTTVAGDAFNNMVGLLDFYCNIAVGSFPSSVLTNSGAGTLYVHPDFYAGYAATHGSKTVAEWTSYPNPMP